MASEEYIVSEITRFEDERARAEVRRAELGMEIGQLINAVAASEVSYELAAKGPLEEPVDLDLIADDITGNRNTLSETVEAAIKATKLGLHRTQDAKILREELVNGVTTAAS